MLASSRPAIRSGNDQRTLSVTKTYTDLDCVLLNSGVQRVFDFSKPESVDMDILQTEFTVNYLSYLALTKGFLAFLTGQERGVGSDLVCAFQVIACQECGADTLRFTCQYNIRIGLGADIEVPQLLCQQSCAAPLHPLPAGAAKGDYSEGGGALPAYGTK